VLRERASGMSDMKEKIMQVIQARARKEEIAGID